MIKDGLVALSLANLCFISSWFAALFDADLGYFNKVPIGSPTLLAFGMNITCVALFAWLAMCARRRSQRWGLRFTIHTVFLLLLLIPADFVRRTILEIPDYQVVAFLKQPVTILGVLALATFVAWQHRLAARIAAIGVGILSPLAILILGKIVLLQLGFLHVAQHTGEPVLPSVGPVHEGQPRVVWIVFDEMDQRLAFEEGPAPRRMAEFARLLGESLYATNAYPPGDGTKISIPSLITGQRVSAVSIANASDLTITLADTGEVVAWSQLPSVFSRAREMGVNTALVGWYHPYTRVLRGALNYCAWYPYPVFEPARAPKFGEAMLRQITCMAMTLHSRKQYADLCRDSLRESLSLVTNATYGLILLHLPPPHKPGIYLPDKGQFTIWGMPKVQGYWNNLLLADHSLGELRNAMEASGQWEKTWLIISADHSWRESCVYDGRRDLRVPFLIKPPAAGKATTISSKINTVLTHDIILAILRGEITDEQSAVAWLKAHPSEQPTVDQKQD